MRLTYQTTDGGLACRINETVSIGPDAMASYNFNATVTQNALCVPSLSIQDIVSHTLSAGAYYTECATNSASSLDGVVEQQACFQWVSVVNSANGQLLVCDQYNYHGRPVQTNGWLASMSTTHAGYSEGYCLQTANGEYQDDFYWYTGTDFSGGTPCPNVYGTANTCYLTSDMWAYYGDTLGHCNLQHVGKWPSGTTFKAACYATSQLPQ